MCIPVEALPELPDRECGGRMPEPRRELGQWPQHVGALEQIGPRELQALLLAYQIPVQEHVEIHRARRPARSVALASAASLDRMQPLEYSVHRQRRGETGDQVDEVVALESLRTVAIPRGEAHAGKPAPELRHRLSDATLGFDVAAGGDIDLRHRSARAL